MTQFLSAGGAVGGGGKTLTFRDMVCPPHLSLNKLVQAVCMESNKLTTNKFVRENNIIVGEVESLYWPI